MNGWNPTVPARDSAHEAPEITPEIVLPAQYFAVRRSGAAQQPEKRLMLAVLEDAVSAFQRHVTARGASARRAFADAEAWIGSDDATWPFAFLNICHTLGLEPDAIRRGLYRWRDAARARPDGGPVITRTPFRRINGTRTKTTEWRRCA